MTEADIGDPSACPFLDWDLYCPIEWDQLDDDGKVQVRYATKLFSEAFVVPGVLTVRSLPFAHRYYLVQPCFPLLKGIFWTCALVWLRKWLLNAWLVDLHFFCLFWPSFKL